MTLFDFMSTYYVEDYKPKSVVESHNQEALLARGYPFEFRHVTVDLEWFTYDNGTINIAPYELFVVVKPKSTRLRRIDIVSVSLKSSLNRHYSFSPSTQWPVVMDIKNCNDLVSHTFKPAFWFQFDKKEEISTRIELLIHTVDEVKREMIDVQWVPVRVKHRAPLI